MDPAPTLAERSGRAANFIAAAAAYLLPVPLKWIAARNGTPLARHHLRQSLALTFLAVCLVLTCILLFLVSTWLHVRFEKAALDLRLGEWMKDVLFVLACTWAAAWLLGIVCAACGSERRIPLVARLGGIRWVRRTGAVAGTILLVLLILLLAVAVRSPSLARTLDGKPAAVYILYDDREAPRTLVTFLAFPTIRAADRRWGEGSTVVAPITRESLREALLRGRLVYVAVHGECGPLLWRGGAFTPEEIARDMTIGKDLGLVYLSACHGGDIADRWEAVLAPARVISYPRFSAHLEHAWFLWFRAPRIIAAWA